MRVNNKGFTLIELLLSIGLISVIVTALFTFFISNFRNFDRNEGSITLQQNARSSIELMTEKIIESKGIFKVWDENKVDVTENYNNGEEISISAFVLDTLEYKVKTNVYDKSVFFITKAPTEDYKKIEFGWVKDNHGLGYSQTTNQANMEVAYYIENIKIKKLNSNGVTITLDFKKDKNSTKPLDTNIYFRNE
ncbi:prepilin-type N-terminal cleavage/methylation domain-containing protein [Clostridium sp. D2Q-11]|uniref:Prepilin-type N-terminal cleavage/methylation domain-containing protein n=1 Tax=Anaeromonas frigoriresistens TaxID=2683708 RepID=A0A942ZAQ4_9FIRM|nr:prepilin-type N-terminal cleavage/methylation domain-containing protein [Anaeromonas frigoriresistens]MBS4540005.1 prepilin-type N-terminal cleavage/methylation domain-containing protein [Anaeromonas frigoriresistens]